MVTFKNFETGSHAAQTGLEPPMWSKMILNFDPPASIFRLLRSQACATTPVYAEVVTEPGDFCTLPTELYPQPKVATLT